MPEIMTFEFAFIFVLDFFKKFNDVLDIHGYPQIPTHPQGKITDKCLCEYDARMEVNFHLWDRG